MSDDPANRPPCDGCRKAVIAVVRGGAACGACIRRACRDSAEDWAGWFAVPAPPPTAIPSDAVTEAHSDLAVAYAERGLTLDALYESVLAARAGGPIIEACAVAILEALHHGGWARLRDRAAKS